jgi:hypothetical protein
MKKSLLLSLLFLLTCASAAKTAQDAAGRYSKDGLSFDYPAGWTLADKSAGGAQYLLLTLPDSSASVQVLAHREPLQNIEQLRALQESFTVPYVNDLARKLGLPEAPQWKDAQCLNFGGHVAEGVRLKGQFNGQPSAAEVYTTVVGRRPVHLIYVRMDRDDARGSEAWKAVLDSLAVEPPKNSTPEEVKLGEIVAGGILDFVAKKKPAPAYPPSASAARASGTVVVQIVFDERGDVVSARAVSGPVLLREPSENAARAVKFNPVTLCGRAVKVSGILRYNFVRR